MITFFKQKHSFEKRCNESNNVLQKYPHHIPIICEKSLHQKNTPNISKTKYLVPDELTVGQFIYVIRNRLKLFPGESLFLFIGDDIPSSNCLMSFIYQKYIDADGFLYFTYCIENTFG